MRARPFPPLLLSFLLAAPLAAATEGPVLDLSRQSLDFGAVRTGQTAQLSVELKSTGNEPVRISRVGVNCSCGKLRLSTPRRLNVPIDPKNEGAVDLTLEPGQTATLTLTMDTQKLPEGKLEKKCLIFASSSAEPVAVPVQIEILPPPEPPARVEPAPPIAPGPAVQPEPTGPPPAVEIEGDVCDFGEILRGEVASHTFTFRNTGVGELIIHDIRTTCTCTAAKLEIGDEIISEDEIEQRRASRRIGVVPPGASASLEVHMDTAKLTGMQDGYPLRKMVHIMTNDPARSPLTLTLNGTLRQVFLLEPHDVRFMDVRKGEARTVTLTLSSTQTQDFEVTDVEVPGDGLLKVETRELEEGSARKYQLDVTLLPTAPVGRISDTLIVHLNHPKVRECLVPIFGDIQPQVVFEGNGPPKTERLDFEVLDGSKDETRELRIRNLDPSVPYVPERVEVVTRQEPEAFRHEIVEVTPGVEYVIKLTVSKDITQRYFAGKLHIQSSHPDVPVRMIDFRGWIRRPETAAGGSE